MERLNYYNVIFSAERMKHSSYGFNEADVSNIDSLIDAINELVSTYFRYDAMDKFTWVIET